VFPFPLVLSRRETEEMAWTVNVIGIGPALPDVVQLIRSEGITPVISGSHGILLGEINSARLLDYAGHHAATLEQYIRMTLHSVARALRVTRLNDSGDGALCDQLDRIGRSRGVSASCADFLQALQASNTGEHNLSALFKNAKKIYEWKQEILKGERAAHEPSIRPKN
jgi:hypothetical protein